MTAPASFDLKGLSTWSFPAASTMETLNGVTSKVGKNEVERCMFLKRVLVRIAGVVAADQPATAGDLKKIPEPSNTEQYTVVIAVLGARVTTHARVVELVTKHIREVQHADMQRALDGVAQRMNSVSPQPVPTSPLPAGKPDQRVPSVDPIQQIDSRMTYRV